MLRLREIGRTILSLAIAAALIGASGALAFAPVLPDVDDHAGGPAAASSADNSAYHVKLPGAKTAHGWLFDPSRYSNNPDTGQRVDQFSQKKPADKVPFSQYYGPNGPDPYNLYAPSDRLFYGGAEPFGPDFGPAAHPSYPYGVSAPATNSSP